MAGEPETLGSERPAHRSDPLLVRRPHWRRAGSQADHPEAGILNISARQRPQPNRPPTAHRPPPTAIGTGTKSTAERQPSPADLFLRLSGRPPLRRPVCVCCVNRAVDVPTLPHMGLRVLDPSAASRARLHRCCQTGLRTAFNLTGSIASTSQTRLDTNGEHRTAFRASRVPIEPRRVTEKHSKEGGKSDPDGVDLPAYRVPRRPRRDSLG